MLFKRWDNDFLFSIEVVASIVLLLTVLLNVVVVVDSQFHPLKYYDVEVYQPLDYNDVFVVDSLFRGSFEVSAWEVESAGRSFLIPILEFLELPFWLSAFWFFGTFLFSYRVEILDFFRDGGNQ